MSWTRAQYLPQGHSTMVNEMERWRGCQCYPGSGRPRKTTPVTDRKLIIACKRNQFDSVLKFTLVLSFGILGQESTVQGHNFVFKHDNAPPHRAAIMSLNASMRIRFQLSCGHCYHPTFFPSNMPGMLLVDAREIPFLLHLSKICYTD